jgi:hypothetical protein
MDGRNTWTREIKHIKQNCAPSWAYLRDYTGMDGQQNIKKVRRQQNSRFVFNRRDASAQ